MEVILLEKIRNLGNLGDTVAVKAGYGRNYLIPFNKAVFATKENIQRFEKQRSEFEQKAQQALESATARATQLEAITIVIQAMASDEGRLYGSVGPSEIKEALQAKSIEVSKREITMPDGPLHFVGDYTVELHLHSDVVAKIAIQVVADAGRKINS